MFIKQIQCPACCVLVDNGRVIVMWNKCVTGSLMKVLVLETLIREIKDIKRQHYTFKKSLIVNKGGVSIEAPGAGGA